MSFANHRGTFHITCLLATIIASSTSTINLWILFLLRKNWSGYLSLVTMMTFFQFLYDISFYSGIVQTENYKVTIVSNTIQLFSGLTSSLTSNLVAFIAFYVIYFKRAFDIKRYFFAMITTVVALSLVDAILYILSQANPKEYNWLANFSVLNYYYFIKIASIGANFLLVLWTAWLTKRMNSKAVNLNGNVRSRTEASLNALSLRLFFYPIVQCISRSGCAWYEISYGIHYTRGQGFTFDPPHTSKLQFIAQLMVSFSMPIASVGYLIIFLVMQPRAYEKFRKILYCLEIRFPVGKNKSASLDDHMESQDEDQPLQQFPQDLVYEDDKQYETVGHEYHHHHHHERDFDLEESETGTIRSYSEGEDHIYLQPQHAVNSIHASLLHQDHLQH